MNSDCIVIIPIYREFLYENEVFAINQCLKIIKNRPIRFISYAKLNFEYYKKNFPGIKFDIFDQKYFSSIRGYNKLLLSKDLYSKYFNFNFILIYQTDCWIFKDELKFWCNKKFDFIGAPWFEGYGNANENSQLIGIGNGGFSLRNIQSALKVLSSFRYIDSPKVVFKRRFCKIKNTKDFIRQFLGLFCDLTFRNNTFYLFNNFDSNEDGFWSQIAPKLFSWYKVAPVEEAIHFSFECNPQKLYELTNHKLPFGCHAWEKHNKPFWLKHIKI
ncbi:MAG: DUF5672 family protein [Sphingobacteriia bacterium]|jgi:hypothetical protein